jgi:hypothetical protein
LKSPVRNMIMYDWGAHCQKRAEYNIWISKCLRDMEFTKIYKIEAVKYEREYIVTRAIKLIPSASFDGKTPRDLLCSFVALRNVSKLLIPRG